MSFITPAYAQAADAGSVGGQSMMFVPLILIFVIMYFLIIRPQRAQMKKHQEMVNSARRGDQVVTGGGLIGKVTKVFDETGEVEVEVADGVRVRVVRSTLSSVRVKGEPVADNKDTGAKKKGGRKDVKANDKPANKPEAANSDSADAKSEADTSDK